MSTEIRVGDLHLGIPDVEAEPSSGEIATHHRVMHTAGDLPDVAPMPAILDPAADHVDPELARRRDDVELKHRRVAEFLDRGGFDAVLLGRADSVAWFTAGGRLRQDLGGDRASVLVFVNRQSRAILADNVQSPRVFEEEVAGLGFHLKERPWHEPVERTLGTLGRGKRVATDLPDPSQATEYEPGAIRGLRLCLTSLERQRLRELGRALTLCVEATCRNFNAGETEADVAGHLAHRMLRQGVDPVELRVAGDDRPERFRQATFTAAPIHDRVVVAATGRRHGLCASLTRIVCFGPVDPSFRREHEVAAMVDASAIYFSRPGVSVGEVFRRSRRIYEKFGHPHEWTLADQGSVVGYSPRELPLIPEGRFVIRADLPLRWTPSVGAARSEDTVVIDDRGFEVVTELQRWPKLDIQVKGFNLPRPGILER